VSFKEQIMSKDNYRSIFSCQMEAIVFIILQTFFHNIGSFENCQNLNPRIFPSFGWGIFSHMTRFDETRVSKNI